MLPISHFLKKIIVHFLDDQMDSGDNEREKEEEKVLICCIVEW